VSVGDKENVTDSEPEKLGEFVVLWLLVADPGRLCVTDLLTEWHDSVRLSVCDVLADPKSDLVPVSDRLQDWVGVGEEAECDADREYELLSVTVLEMLGDGEGKLGVNVKVRVRVGLEVGVRVKETVGTLLSECVRLGELLRVVLVDHELLCEMV